MSNNSIPRQHLDAFSHVVECIFLLQQDNVICQADLWGDSGNLCTLYMLLTIPLDTLIITYGRHNPSLTHTRIGLHKSKTCMTIAIARPPGLITISLFDFTSSHFDSYCMLLTYHHGWLPPVLPF
jgi:hypothetical protein